MSELDTDHSDFDAWLESPEGVAAVEASSHVDDADGGEDGLIHTESTDPNRLADLFLGKVYSDRGRALLRRYNGEWFGYANFRGYDVVPPERIKAQIRAFLDSVRVPVLDKNGDPTGYVKPLRVTTHAVNEVEAACIRCAPLMFPTIVTGDIPQWLDGRERPQASRVIAFRNGWLDVDKYIACGGVELMPATPDWFGGHVCPFDFDAGASEPKELYRFLASVWPDDEDQRQTLQEWIGYLMTPDTSQQKAMLLIGPKRSGKGTIFRVIAHLLGRQNVAAPTLASFASNFGLWPLIGKSLAVVGDARLSGKADQAAVVERILSITGEDAQTIDRKNMVPVTLKLPTRIMMGTNELPRLSDASGALASRFIILQMHRSFFGNEELGLTEKLIAEAPSILLWALEGLRRLHQRGRFLQPASVSETIGELEDLSSPVRAFVRDCCEVEAGPRTTIADAYAAWCIFCEGEGRPPGPANLFSRDIKAAFPQLRTVSLRVAGGGEETRVRALDGIRLKLSMRYAVDARQSQQGANHA